MKASLYSIKDNISNTFGRIMEQNNNPEAIRSFTDIVGNPESTVSKHPKDYTLYKLGEFDTETGIITTSKSIPTELANGENFIKKEGE